MLKNQTIKMDAESERYYEFSENFVEFYNSFNYSVDRLADYMGAIEFDNIYFFN